MQSLGDALENTVRTYARRPAVVEAHASLTWAQHGEAFQTGADALRLAGLVKGDRIGVLGLNSARQGELLFAAYWAGIIPVPLNYRLSAREIAAILNDADCALLCLDSGFEHMLGEPALSSWRGRCLYFNTPEPDRTREPQAKPSYEALKEAAEPVPKARCQEHEEALLLYTGGTTGAGKGVRLSHRNILTNALQTIGSMLPQPDDVYLHLTPMFHAAEVKSTIFTLCGSAHAYTAEFDPRDLLQTIETLGVTVIPMVPATIARVLAEPALKDFDLSSLRLISYGTSPIAPAVIREMMDAFPGVGLQQSYGVTECSPYIVMLDEQAHRRAMNGEEHLLASAGRPLPGTDLRLLDDDGEEVSCGDVGEVVIRGPQVALGYLHRPEEERTAFTPSGYRTGDVGYMDEEGFVYLVDRKKDMLISGGENIYTQEVETVLSSHPGVAQVAVIGVPHETYGEAPFAVIVSRGDPHPSVDELIAFCRDSLGGYKIPRQMAFVDQLPRSAMGKVRKEVLKNTYAKDS